ncbi:MAG: DUF945 family protein [Xanthomonadales bacterium]|nr:DUF945 family protein [Xanthomonadales bacterium]
MRRILIILILVAVAVLLALPAGVGFALARVLPAQVQQLDERISSHQIRIAHFERGWFGSRLAIEAVSDAGADFGADVVLQHGPLRMALLSGDGGIDLLEDAGSTPIAQFQFRLEPRLELTGQLTPADGSGTVSFETRERFSRTTLTLDDITIAGMVEDLDGSVDLAHTVESGRVFEADLAATAWSAEDGLGAQDVTVELEVSRSGEALGADMTATAGRLDTRDQGTWIDLAGAFHVERLHAPTLAQLVRALGKPDAQAMAFTALGPLLLFSPRIEVLRLQAASPDGGIVSVDGSARFLRPPKPDFITDFSRLARVLSVDLEARLGAQQVQRWAQARIDREFPTLADPELRRQFEEQLIADLLAEGLLERDGAGYAILVDYEPDQLRINGQPRPLPDWAASR